MCGVVGGRIALERLFWGAVWSHGVVEHLLCEVMCLGVRRGS
eukprot:COSAG05_NODE_6522_length_943_cov_1.831754_2_plen_41_part_01